MHPPHMCIPRSNEATMGLQRPDNAQKNIGARRPKTLWPQPPQGPPPRAAYSAQGRIPPPQPRTSEVHNRTRTLIADQQLVTPKAAKWNDKATAQLEWTRPYIQSIEGELKPSTRDRRTEKIALDVQDLRVCCTDLETELHEAKNELRELMTQSDASYPKITNKLSQLESQLENVKARIANLESMLDTSVEQRSEIV